MAKYKNLPLVSATLVIINVIVFFICLFTGDWLYDLGGVSWEGVLGRHEYGRLLWAMFLHGDTEHLFNNMIILFFLGAMLEKETGHICLAVIYFLSGLGGNVVSLIGKVLTEDIALSIGASGAVFGLDGLLLAMVLLSEDFRNRMSPIRVILVIGLSVYDGFMGSNIDNAAHIGGLVIGFLAGLIYVTVCNIRNRKNRREVQF